MYCRHTFACTNDIITKSGVDVKKIENLVNCLCVNGAVSYENIVLLASLVHDRLVVLLGHCVPVISYILSTFHNSHTGVCVGP